MYTAHSHPISNWAFDLANRLVTRTMHLHPIETGRMAEHLYAVKTGTVNFFVYQDAGQAICIDAGFGKNIILRELGRLNIDPGSITHLFLTHSDLDHAGGSALFEKAKIYLSAGEEPMITRKKARMFGFIYNPRLERAYQLLNDGDLVSAGPIQIRAIATPGHTLGSMSYFVNESILFVGDTFKLIDGKVYPKRPYINMDTEQQKASIRKLARLEAVRLACTAHNGYTEAFHEAIRDWGQAGLST
jgi:hydroxyacylglutathione hydrolase